MGTIEWNISIRSWTFVDSVSIIWIERVIKDFFENGFEETATRSTWKSTFSRCPFSWRDENSFAWVFSWKPRRIWRCWWRAWHSFHRPSFTSWRPTTQKGTSLRNRIVKVQPVKFIPSLHSDRFCWLGQLNFCVPTDKMRATGWLCVVLVAGVFRADGHPAKSDASVTLNQILADSDVDLNLLYKSIEALLDYVVKSRDLDKFVALFNKFQTDKETHLKRHKRQSFGGLGGLGSLNSLSQLGGLGGLGGLGQFGSQGDFSQFNGLNSFGQTGGGLLSALTGWVKPAKVDFCHDATGEIGRKGGRFTWHVRNFLSSDPHPTKNCRIFPPISR